MAQRKPHTVAKSSHHRELLEMVLLCESLERPLCTGIWIAFLWIARDDIAILCFYRILNILNINLYLSRVSLAPG
jgi:hypothetical protein